MKINKLLIPILFVGLIFSSCSKEDDLATLTKPGELEVENFIYTGLNDIYLYKADVPELEDNYFSSDSEKNKFLATFGSPEELFDGLLSPDDRFSFLVDDYIALENMFSGISTTNGMELTLLSFGTNKVFAVVKYVLPNTSADEEGIKRGDVFVRVDGQQMTEGNYSKLLAADTYTINIAEFIGNQITETGETATLSKEEYSTNPVHIVKTLDIGGRKVGYIMYNSFTADYDSELNAAFAELKAQGVTDLVLDLRYNGGGSVETAVDLSSMITGQFEGELFMREQWNDSYQAYFEETDPDYLLNEFNSKIRTGELINSLKLDQVYVLTTDRTASASELVINGLEPYIDVVQVGTTTTGKFQASVTLYDSPDFGREDASENHTYAMQPLVLKSVNADGKSDYLHGLVPDIKVEEDVTNFGVLGDENEPLLRAALNDILGIPQSQQKTMMGRKASMDFEKIGETGMQDPTYQKMYIDKVPPIINR